VPFNRPFGGVLHLRKKKIKRGDAITGRGGKACIRERPTRTYKRGVLEETEGPRRRSDQKLPLKGLPRDLPKFTEGGGLVTDIKKRKGRSRRLPGNRHSTKGLG